MQSPTASPPTLEAYQQDIQVCENIFEVLGFTPEEIATVFGGSDWPTFRTRIYTAVDPEIWERLAIVNNIMDNFATIFGGTDSGISHIKEWLAAPVHETLTATHKDLMLTSKNGLILTSRILASVTGNGVELGPYRPLTAAFLNEHGVVL